MLFSLHVESLGAKQCLPFAALVQPNHVTFPTAMARDDVTNSLDASSTQVPPSAGCPSPTPRQLALSTRPVAMSLPSSYYHCLFLADTSACLQQWSIPTYWGYLDLELYCCIFAGQTALSRDLCSCPSHLASSCCLVALPPPTLHPAVPSAPTAGLAPTIMISSFCDSEGVATHILWQEHLIINLSAPHGSSEPSINSLVPSSDFSLHSTVDDAASLIKQAGLRAWLTKADIISAFKILPLHPDFWHLFAGKANPTLQSVSPSAAREAPRFLAPWLKPFIMQFT
ncbi:hypothetical protein SRHO_G00312410 [Serrasalmus rhombeus]